MKGKKWTPVLITFLFWGVFSTPLRAMDPDPDITGTAIAELIEVLSAEEASPLNFGRFFIDGQGGGTISITASPALERIASGNALQLASGGSPGPAVYQVTGYPQASVNITRPGPALLIHATNPAHRMLVDTWTSFPDYASNLVVFCKLSFYLGATLHVESLSQNREGVYSGSYNVTLAYD